MIREDPEQDGLLYAGTELGLFVSFDDGANWQPFQFNLPIVPITDLAIKNGDLVVATQGRAFWVLDDLTAVRQYQDSIATEKIHLFKPRPAVRFPGGGFGGDEEGSAGALGKNPPNGVLVSYYLKEKPGEKDVLTVEFLEGDKVLRSFTSEKKTREGEEAGAGGPPAGGGGPGDDDGDKPIEPKAGLNRLVWDMRIVKPSLLPEAIIWGNSQGPKVAPGTYAVRVKYAGQTLTENVRGAARTPTPERRPRT